MSKYKKYPRGEWVTPKMEGYKMACCDCCLVHSMDFRVLEILDTAPDGRILIEPTNPAKYQIQFRTRRNNRSTAQLRRARLKK